MIEPEPRLPSDTVTSTTLLDGLKDPGNATVWRQWVERYRPLVVSAARRMGLSAADAEDVAQNALLAFAEAYRLGRYESAQGRLRSWLMGIVRNQVLRWRQRAPLGDGPEPPDEPAAAGELEAIWEEEWRAAVLRHCLGLVRGEFEPRTIEAFERFALREEPARMVGGALGLSENAVFGAKRRVLRRLQELEPLLDEVF